VDADRRPFDAIAAPRLRRYTLPGSQLTVGPLAHVAEIRERLDHLRFEHFAIERMASTLGAEVSGIDLSAELESEVVLELRRALLEFKVLVFRDQPMTGAQQISFARRFGDLEHHPFLENNPEIPELVRFEKSADVGGYENGWHNDVTWREIPSMGAVLRAVSVPSTGGDTVFADAEAAYAGLDEPTRTFVENLTAEHDFAQAFGPGLDADALEELRGEYPVVRHPVIRTHPETHRRSIFVNRFFTSGIVGLDEAAGHELIARLCAELDTPEYQTRVRWRPNTVVFWDNRSVQHYACSDYWPDVRVMERASIIGDRPL
jgi:taurine dioxygenase